MSRGLGALQREILATLDEAKTAAWQIMPLPEPEGGWPRAPMELLRAITQARKARTDDVVEYRGAARTEYYQTEPGWVRYHGRRVCLAQTVYDLRASLRYLAHRHGALYPYGPNGGYIRETFGIAFSRAVRTLIRRCVLGAPPWVPLADWKDTRAHVLAEPWPEVRFLGYCPLEQLANCVHDGWRYYAAPPPAGTYLAVRTRPRRFVMRQADFYRIVPPTLTFTADGAVVEEKRTLSHFRS